MCESLIKKTDKTPSSWWNEASRRYNCLYIESHLDIATSPVYLNDLREGPRSTVPVPDSHCDGAGPCLLSRGNPTALNPTTTVFTLSLVKKIQNFLPPPKLRKRLPFDNNDVFRYQLYGLGETNELQSMDIFCFSKSISFENDIGKYVKNPGEMLATLSFVL